ncbi:peptide-methionine (S)-S-oxide reductase [Antarcticibacterium sp. 1MA-6-2]|uniref:peptide-methionine (S)-S-oxide reductase n=1 Tax=Antarcticibacterium sp. 1MA-6-2 TaxID=2908210 RepID=UPI001F44317C|nr:peptide-methionine (S)-S-oxide reductase [Antarcticibacterium sp. 1MA-6-2]UJH91596.1 peptide-methionine (S)-S-oxide reductase [Antarcticibacterium sp. 1MA-6-2]
MGNSVEKIALGGGCHWCTEAVFQELKGVEKVEQGFVASSGKNSSFSEAVIVYFDPTLIPLERLIEIHLHTHSSTSGHSMRSKYRSAIYTFNETQNINASNILQNLQLAFKKSLVTEVLSFRKFKISAEEFQNYYKKDPSKPFCRSYINPKLKKLLLEFSENL